jgi:hypothetical protein
MHGNWKYPVSKDQVARIAADMDRQGFACVSDYLSENELEILRRLAYDAGHDPTGKYAKLQEMDTLAGTALAALPSSPQFRTLCQQLYEFGTGSTALETHFYQVFRCLRGAVGRKNSYLFHYDSYVLTVLIPIVIPTEGERGDLLIFPNMRPMRRTYFRNLIDKILIDNPVSRIVLREAAKRRKMGAIAVTMHPGNVYFFWGYRSIHANEPCDPNQLRATALLHFGDPYRGSTVRTVLRSVRRLAAA